ncbi:MAG: hypothetical protein FWG15_05090 [Propionibacteriaceae bacterium]|nr:hypothetical protein [Propionibacteriaceae bacterium]
MSDQADNQSADNSKKPPAKPKTMWMTVAALATALVVLGVLIWAPGVKIPLSDRSHGVTVTSASVIPKGKQTLELAPQNETQLLTGTDIFTGEVLRIESIKVKFADWDTYYSILTVQVGQVVRGNLAPGSEVRVMLTTAIGIDCDNCEAHSMLRTGSHVLFLATPASRGFAQATDGSGIFQFAEVANYYLTDPVRPLFVDFRRSDGVGYDQETWVSLSDETLTNVDQVASLIESMIAQG